MATDIATEAALAQDIEALRERFTQTQELYREVCALLFFRYGVTPTANKLYQLVRKGSMSAPAEALTKFWGDLREKSRTRIEHPDLPEALKSVAGELVATLWTSAQAAAQESLMAYRAEIQEGVLQAKANLASTEAERDAAQSVVQSVKSELERARQEIGTQCENLAVAEEMRNSLLARLDEAKHENAVLQRQLGEVRREFALELDKQRTAMLSTEERSRSTEKRVLLEMDRERTASARLQKELETLTTGSLRAADQHRQELNLLQQALGDSRQKIGQLEGSLQTVAASLERAGIEVKEMQAQLGESSAQVALYRSQAEEWRRKFEESQECLRKTQTIKATARRTRRP